MKTNYEELIDKALGLNKPKAKANGELNADENLTEEEKTRLIKAKAEKSLATSRKVAENVGLFTAKDKEFFKKKDQEENLDKLLNISKK